MSDSHVHSNKANALRPSAKGRATGQFDRIVVEQLGEQQGQRALDAVRNMERFCRSVVEGWLGLGTLIELRGVPSASMPVRGGMSVFGRGGRMVFKPVDAQTLPTCLWVFSAIHGQQFRIGQESFSPDLDDGEIQGTYILVGEVADKSLSAHLEVSLDVVWLAEERRTCATGFRINLMES